jgi:cytochrome oxidase Cu insertion factor (SCO1/SenC/PrrC family)
MRSMLLVILMVFVAGCVSSMPDNNAASAPSENPSVAQSNWLDIEMTDVNTGNSFKLSDFQGEVVVIETMAVWCPLCTQQQKEIQIAESSLDVVSVSIDIDPNEDAAKLKSHAESNNFHWRYAISPRNMSLELQNLFSSSVLNPTATPIIILDKTQNPHLLRFGVKGSSELVQEISKYL